MDIFASLNPAQKEAVETLSGPLLILAGAGSGKTKTLTHRIANLINHQVLPEQILAVTFTNKAAREMRERLWKILYPDAAEVAPRTFMPYMGTFHSICVRILRQEAQYLSLNHNFVIYDTDDQIALIKHVIKKLKLNDQKSLKPRSIQSIISKSKNDGQTPEEYASGSFYPNQKQIAKIYQQYEIEKQHADALDFDDLLLKVLELFRTNPTVRQAWRHKFQHILIDEYQDTNSVQYQLIKLLVNEQQNICVVGDDWQSIYSWRGADFTNILNFERDFPGAKVIKLEQNYRSTGNILQASQKIINQNKTRTDKALFTEAENGEAVDIESARDETEEARFVARKILEYHRQYPNFADFAVLYRTNAQSYAFEKAFIDFHIPYKIIGGVRFYDRKEIKDVLAILHLILNRRDKISLERVCKNVLSGIGAVSLEKLLQALDVSAEVDYLDLVGLLKSTKAKQSFQKFARFFNEISLSLSVAEIIQKTIDYFQFEKMLEDGTENGAERFANLGVLASNAVGYESLEEFLADASLMSSVDERNEHDSVTLMTMHAAKGLEFSVVFMVGMEDGLFPSLRIEKEADLEEERRLAYVGMTRAMKKLFLTYAASRYSFGDRNYNMPSRFLIELGYNPYGSSGYHDESDDFNDFTTDDFDPFPEEEIFPDF